MTDTSNKHFSQQSQILGGWQVDLRELTLSPVYSDNSKAKVELRPKVMQVLACLMQQQGHLVTREELIDSVWEGNQYVGENGLNDAIWQLRKCLDEDTQNAPYIQTVPKKGYRLQVVSGDTSINSSNRTPTKFALPALLTFVLVVGLLWFDRNQKQTVQLPEFDVVTQKSGNETYPEISPNGKYLLYTHISQAGLYRIYLKELDSSDPTSRLVPVAEGLHSGFATWSAQSDRIVFVASDLRSSCEIRTYELISQKEHTVGQCTISKIAGLSWNTSRDLVAYSDKDENSDATVIALLDVNSGEKTQLTNIADNKPSTDRYARFSPSGDEVAFIRQVGVGNTDIYKSDLNGNTTRVTQWNTSMLGFTWGASENELIIAETDNNKIGLFHYTIDTGLKTEIMLNGHEGGFPSYHAGSNQLIYSKRSLAKGLMSLDIEPQPNTVRVKALFQSPSTDIYPNYSVVTGQTAFISNRDGFDELWLADSNNQFTQLTQLKTEIYSPAWSPDGRQIAFTAADTKNKYRQLFVIDVASKNLRQLTFEDTDHAPPTWSLDGVHLYSGVAAGGEFYLWKYQLDGTKQQLLQSPSIYALEHPQKDTLLYTDMRQGGIFEYDFATGSTSKLIENNSRTDGSNWLTTDSGVYYVMRSETQDVINFYEFDSQSHRTIMQFPSASVSAFQTIALNPDTQQLLFVQRFKQESDLQRVTNPMLPD